MHLGVHGQPESVRAPQKGAAAQRGRLTQEIWTRMRQVAEEYDADLKLQYVCGHANVTMNERADCLADQAAEFMQQEKAPVELPAAAAVCQRQARESWERRETARHRGRGTRWTRVQMEEGATEMEGEKRRSREGV